MASLENRQNGTWRITICHGLAPNGKKNRLQETVKVDPSKTENAQRQEVERIAAALETDLRRNLITAAKKIRLSDLAEDFLSDKPISDSTKKFYEHLFTRILAELGRLYVQDFTPRHIRDFKKALEKAPAKSGRSKTGKLSGTYQNHYFRALHALFAYAVRLGYITTNPVDSVDPPRKDTQETPFYELSECGKLLSALDSLPDLQWRLFFTLAIYTGCRPGELIALNWSDLNDSVLSIQAGSAYVKGKGTIRTDRPKTRSSIRLIDLPEPVLTLLRQHKKEQAEYRLQFGSAWPEPDAIFTGDEGYRFNISSPTQKWAKIVKQYDLRPIPLYGLRHTAATIMIFQGLNARDVAARLGHSQTSTTLNIYAHSFADANSRATSAISAALEKARAEAK